MLSLIRFLYFKAEEQPWFSPRLLTYIVLLKAVVNQFSLRFFALRNRREFANFPQVFSSRDKSASDALFIVGRGPTRAAGLKEHSEILRTSEVISLNDEWLDPWLPRIRFTEKWRKSKSRVSDSLPIFEKPWFETPPLAREDRRALRKLGRVENGPIFYITLNTMTSKPERAVDLFFDPILTRALSTFAPSVLLGSQASVLRAVGLAIRGGFNKIVLIGVDFVLEEHFDKAKGAKIEDLPENFVHPSASGRLTKRWRGISVLRMLLEINERLLCDGRGGLYVGHSESPLCAYLPLFEAPNGK